MSFLNRFFYKSRAKKVAAYYNTWSEKFQTITDTFQGFRPENIDEFHQYTIEQAQISKYDKVLDAGCGVGGPSFFFAKNTGAKIASLTNSSVQVAIIQKRKAVEKIENLEAYLGDYHDLPAIFPDKNFTRVLFLESLGHSLYPEKAIQAAYSVLASNGKLYIRDLFKRDVTDPQESKEVNKLVKEANQTFVYHHATGREISELIQRAGFKIEYCKMPQIVFKSIDHEFERRFGIRTPKGIPFVEPLEILAVKS